MPVGGNPLIPGHIVQRTSQRTLKTANWQAPGPSPPLGHTRDADGSAWDGPDRPARPAQTGPTGLTGPRAGRIACAKCRRGPRVYSAGIWTAQLCPPSTTSEVPVT